MRFTWEEQCRGRGRGSGRKVTHIIFEFDFKADQLDMDMEVKGVKGKKKKSPVTLPYNLEKRLRTKAELNASQIEKISAWLAKNPAEEKAFSSYINSQIEIPVDTGGTDYRGRKIDNVQAWAWAKVQKVLESGVPTNVKNPRGYG